MSKIEVGPPVPVTRTSHVTIGITRLLATAQFENIQIKLETTEEISWSSLAERAKKVDHITKLLTDQYTKTQETVCVELGVEEKRAWRKNKPQPTGDFGETFLPKPDMQ